MVQNSPICCTIMWTYVYEQYTFESLYLYKILQILIDIVVLLGQSYNFVNFYNLSRIAKTKNHRDWSSKNGETGQPELWKLPNHLQRGPEVLHLQNTQHAKQILHIIFLTFKIKYQVLIKKYPYLELSVARKNNPN